MEKDQAIARRVQRGRDFISQRYASVIFAGDRAADELINDLATYPHAFVLACLMDRQMRAEKCWLIPYTIREKLGGFEFPRLAALTEDRVVELMSQPQPLHRFPQTMGKVFYQGVQHIEARYNGDASRIWANNPSSATLVRRFLEFNGAGQKIATMAANLLVREFKIPVRDKYSIDVSLDVQVRRVLRRLGLVPESAGNEVYLYTAREINPEYPWVIDLACWEIGRNWCRAKKPQCNICSMSDVCPSVRGRS